MARLSSANVKLVFLLTVLFPVISTKGMFTNIKNIIQMLYFSIYIYLNFQIRLGMILFTPVKENLLNWSVKMVKLFIWIGPFMVDILLQFVTTMAIQIGVLIACPQILYLYYKPG